MSARPSSAAAKFSPQEPVRASVGPSIVKRPVSAARAVVNSRISREKKVIEVNRRPVLSIDKENEIEKRRRDIARQKEAREKQIKDEVREIDYT